MCGVVCTPLFSDFSNFSSRGTPPGCTGTPCPYTQHLTNKQDAYLPSTCRLFSHLDVVPDSTSHTHSLGFNATLPWIYTSICRLSILTTDCYSLHATELHSTYSIGSKSVATLAQVGTLFVCRAPSKLAFVLVVVW